MIHASIKATYVLFSVTNNYISLSASFNQSFYLSTHLTSVPIAFLPLDKSLHSRTYTCLRFRAVAAVSHGSDATERSNLPVRHLSFSAGSCGPSSARAVICFQLRRGVGSRSFRTSWQVALRWPNAAADL